MKREEKLKTRCVHAGELVDEKYGGATSPIYMSTSYKFTDVEFNQYPRYFNTPNQLGLANKIASLEGAESGLIFSSGMAAISNALLSHLKSGDHVIFQNDLYGGTRNFIKKEFPKYGIDFSFTNGISVIDFENEINGNTQGIYLETPSNPTLKIVDLSKIGELAKDKNIWTMIDNTFASPVNQNPIKHGIVLHSATKYLGGHSDICAGAVLGSKESIQRIFNLAKNLGGSLSEMTVWLLERSIKTLFIRVQAQNDNAKKIAEFLDSESWISKVYYPGLNHHPNHDIAVKQMKGFGGMLSFELVPEIDSKKFLLNLNLIKPTMSLAGVESTALSPRLTSHALLTDNERKQQGINSQLIRFSTGIESFDDLKNDLLNAIRSIS